MDFNHREQRMLKVLLQSYPDAVSVKRLEQVLEVSRRTVYRELNSLKTSLSALDIGIEHQRGRGYTLKISDSSQIDQLDQLISQEEQQILGNDERQRYLLLQLLYTNQPLTSEALAYQFDVSLSTIEQDMQRLEEALNQKQLTLNRQPGVGTLVRGSEFMRQQLATMLVHNSVSEMTFYRYLDQLKQGQTEVKAPSVLRMLNQHHLFIATQVIEQQVEGVIERVSDTQLMRVIIGTAILLDRLSMNKEMDAVKGIKRIDQHIIHLSHRITAQLSKKLNYSFSIDARHYLALLLAGVNYKESLTIFHQDFDSELVYQVKEFIRAVSQETGNDYRHDAQLFDNLFSHMQAALRRPINLLGKQSFTVLEDMRMKYPDLYQAVERHFKEIFQIQSISQDELTYFVLHFATSLERNPQPQKRVNVLVICSSGIGTSRILESRLKQNIPEISAIQSAKISDLPSLDFERFDLILSTVYLDQFEQDYLIISPLLKMTELEKIQQLIMDKIETQTAFHEEQTDLLMNNKKLFLSQLEHVTKLSRQLVTQLRIISLENERRLEKIIEQMIQELPENITEDHQQTSQTILERVQLSPVGLPQSSMGLFHASTEHVLEPFFGIFDLANAVSIQAMDGEMISLKRILLLLAPNPMDDGMNNILGAISRSLIENDLYSHLYETGDQPMIQELMSRIFIEEIKYYIEQKEEM
ncbi:HTH domain-containing protein [Aerococcaceae bacterium DSM 111020]|nr:HTH domain-containing protein [Aerococcaceae bacterium DSM 111020]